ncbi:MAG: cobyrinate a,c-diamide synthase [Marinifilaceae bacterium]|jgi:cobyrinic acid a,c-diamide synthase|nr:cobyrinate a,c-diamide synthase [Marinifilaceae bacterium]
MKAFILAGTNSGCGKTTISIGLMALLNKYGYNIAPFKTGPDYIDPMFHTKVLSKSSYNLDSVILSEKSVLSLFQQHSKDADIAIIEGVMGMYDGLGKQMKGSSYDLSRILNVPIVLVVNCKALSQSVAAIVKGFTELREDSNVKAVILNNCPGGDYYEYLKEIVEDNCKLKCIGYVPSNKKFELGSRHLGLIQAEELLGFNELVDSLVDVLDQTIDIDSLLKIIDIEMKEVKFELPNLDLSNLNIAIAYDKAFRFYYKDNIELLEKLNANISYFSPLSDTCLPKDVNCLYIGGGYPEIFAGELSENTLLRKDIKNRIENGLPCYAECGGLMYLTDEIIDRQNNSFSMVGVFNSKSIMTERLQRFGYAELDYQNSKSVCHEFHRSKTVDSENKNYNYQYKLIKKQKNTEWECGLRYKNCLAGYAHSHFYSSDFSFFYKIIELWKAKIM